MLGCTVMPQSKRFEKAGGPCCAGSVPRPWTLLSWALSMCFKSLPRCGYQNLQQGMHLLQRQHHWHVQKRVPADPEPRRAACWWKNNE